MANIEYLNNRGDDKMHGADLYGILIAFCGLICMVTAVLGIKLKWFKHRLNFESSLNEFNQTNTTTSTTRPETFRSLNQQYQPTPYEVGVFRKKSDDEFDLERPKDLPPIKLNKSSAKLSRNPKQLSINISKAISQKQNKTAEKFKSEAVNPTIHNNKLNSGSSSKSNRSRSNSRSPKKEQNRHNINNNKKNYEKNSSERTFSPSQKSTNNQQMENKKNIKKKIKFENIPAEKDNPNSSQLHRRPTGFTKLSQKELEELEALSERTPISPEKTQKRRPTGFELLTKEELEELEHLANKEENAIEKKFNSIQFHNIEENDTLNIIKKNEFLREVEDDYGFTNNENKNQSIVHKNLNNYPGVINQENGQLTFKITGFSDNEEEDMDLYSKLKIKTKYDENFGKDNLEKHKPSINLKPEPQPRTTLKQSKDEDTNKIVSKIESVSISSPSAKTISTNLQSNIKTENEEDSWSAVRNYRNITEEMAKHNEAIREAAKKKAAKRELRNPLAYDDMNNTVVSKPKNMKDVKRKQHENEEREKKSNEKVSLNNDKDEESEISC